MKKSELKELIKAIVTEIHASKKVSIKETAGLSGMKKSPDKKENTQMGYEDKSITSTDKPKEKTEGKKLPVVDKKSNTEKDHVVSDKSTPTVPANEKKEGKALPVGGHSAIKEEIVAMIKETVEEYRVKGALGKKKVGQPAQVGLTVTLSTQSGEVITLDEFDFLTRTWPEAKKYLDAEVMALVGAGALDPNAKVGQSVYDAIENAKTLDLDGKLTPENNKVVLQYDPGRKELVANL
jgi:hypothetical protein